MKEIEEAVAKAIAAAESAPTNYYMTQQLQMIKLTAESLKLQLKQLEELASTVVTSW